MDRPLERFGWDESAYERVEQKWICGRACEGTPCELGPSPRGWRRAGQCRGVYACTPLLDENSGTYQCTRRLNEKNAAGRTIMVVKPCDEGPTADGVCCRKRPACRPTRSLRYKRRTAAATMFGMALLIPLFLSLSPAGRPFFSPGHLSDAHAGLACTDCHEAASGTDPFAWHQAGSTALADMERKCVGCHQFDRLADPHGAHGFPEAELARRRPDEPARETSEGFVAGRAHALARERALEGAHMQCISCHSEHEGAKMHLRGNTERDCQVCHQDVFASFSDGHPDFGAWPYARRTSILFDHRQHHEAWFKGDTSITCVSCHNPNDTAAPMRTNFEANCKSCHEDDVTFAGPVPGVAADTPAMELSRPLVLLPGLTDGPQSWGLSPLARILFGEDIAEFECLHQDVKDRVLGRTAEAWPPTILAAARKVYADLALGGDEARAKLAARLRATLGRDHPAAIAALFEEARGLSKAADEAIKNDPQACPPKPGKFGLQEGDLALVYFPTGHADPLLKALVPLIAAFHVARDDWETQFLTGPHTPERSCLKCHSVDREADGSLGIHWEGGRPLTMVPFSHDTHHLGVNKTFVDSDCTSCHAMRGDPSTPEGAADHLARRKRATYGWGDVNVYDPHNALIPAHSDFLPMKRQTCAQCHDRPNVPSNCATCHRYHAGGVKKPPPIRKGD